MIRHLLTIGLAAAAAIAAAAGASAASPEARVAAVLKATPLIDGHNDWAELLAEREGEGRWTLDLRAGLDRRPVPYNTDIARLRAGQVGGQFWSVYVSADLPPLEQVKATLDQIDLVHQIVARYSDTFALARTAADVRRIHREGRIASLIGVEGGGQIDADLSVLRAYHDLGAGYLTLTHVRTIAWADSATDNPVHGGLTPFGLAVVHELNRLGMLVDLSHVSEGVMRAAIAASKAPVMFSHSSSRALDDHPRNVSDDVLRLVAANGGVVMVNFARTYVSEDYRRWSNERAAEQARLNSPPYGGALIGQPDKAAAALAAWEAAHPAPVGDAGDGRRPRRSYRPRRRCRPRRPGCRLRRRRQRAAAGTVGRRHVPGAARRARPPRLERRRPGETRRRQHPARHGRGRACRGGNGSRAGGHGDAGDRSPLR